MVQLGLAEDFNHQVLQWYYATVPMKECIGLIWKSDLSKRKMKEVEMQTAEPDYTKVATEILEKNLDSTYAQAVLKQVANNATKKNSEERTQLLRLLKDSKDLFDGTLGE